MEVEEEGEEGAVGEEGGEWRAHCAEAMQREESWMVSTWTPLLLE